MSRHINSQGNPQLTTYTVPTTLEQWTKEYKTIEKQYNQACLAERWGSADLLGDILADFECYKPEQ